LLRALFSRPLSSAALDFGPAGTVSAARTAHTETIFSWSVVAVELTGKNFFRAVALYNQRPETVRIEYMRVCLVMKLPRAHCVNQLRFPIM